MKKGYLFIVLAALLYSTQEISGKLLASAGMDPLQVMFIVFSIGTILMAPMAFKEMKSRELKLSLKDWRYFALVGILCIPISMLCLQYAVTYTEASTAAVIFCSNAIFTIPFAVLILKTKIKKADLIAMVISVIGIIIIFNPASLFQGLSDSRNLLGLMFALIAAIAWAFYNVVSKIRVGYYGAYVLNFGSFLFGTTVLLIMLLITKKQILAGITPKNFVVLLYMGVFIKFLSYTFFMGAVKLTSPVKTSMVFLIKPALATILAMIILSETIVPTVIIGIMFVLAGTCLSFYDNLKEERQKTIKASPQISRKLDHKSTRA